MPAKLKYAFGVDLAAPSKQIRGEKKASERQSYISTIFSRIRIASSQEGVSSSRSPFSTIVGRTQAAR